MTPLTPHEIAALVRPALTTLYVLYFRTAQQSDLTGPQLTILTRLNEHGSARISRLAQAEGIRMPTVSNAVLQLEQRGMVERVRDESDHRGVQVRLTAFGRRELERVGEERNSYIAEMLETLPEEKIKDVGKLASIIIELADTYSARMAEKNESR